RRIDQYYDLSLIFSRQVRSSAPGKLSPARLRPPKIAFPSDTVAQHTLWQISLMCFEQGRSFSPEAEFTCSTASENRYSLLDRPAVNTDRSV
ncbi:hypothetical protein TNCV_697751, partial [Trichonephila clavipes]